MAAFTCVVGEFLERNKDVYADLGHKIWQTPELQYEEHFAHGLLTSYLRTAGFNTQEAYGNIPTAFRAEFTTSEYRFGVHPTIAILCEYDALPVIGHACGHNLIAEAGVAAACAVRDALLFSKDGSEVPAKIVVLGCPAEEGGGGKIDLIHAGALQDVDFAMMVHPFPHDVLHCITLGIERCNVEYHGKASHASCGPWDGVNALDAAISAYNFVSLLRQQMKPDWRVHAIIVEGGSACNIIPEYSLSQYFMRCQKVQDLPLLKAKLIRCFESAADATGCSVKIDWDPKPYLPLVSNRHMAATFGKFAQNEGVMYGPDPNMHGSSDIGNVSLVVPTIHPRFYAGEQVLIHTREFQKLAGTATAQTYCLRMAKIMALTTLELLTNSQLRAAAKAEFDAMNKT